jgi:hypothetical protein
VIDNLTAQLCAFHLACLVVDFGDEAAASIRAIPALLAENPLLRDRMRGHVCMILARIISENDEVLAGFNQCGFFARVLMEIQDGASRFKLDATFMLAVAFQRLADTELDGFLNVHFVELLETIDMSLALIDGRNLSGQMEAVACRLNRLLPDESELKALLWDIVPQRVLIRFEDEPQMA